MSDSGWERAVFDHVKLTVRDRAASVAFYEAALAPLEIPALWENERGASSPTSSSAAAASRAARST